MRDVPALAEHLANMVTAHDTPRYRTVLKDNIKFLERELASALAEARAEGAREALSMAAHAAAEKAIKDGDYVHGPEGDGWRKAAEWLRARSQFQSTGEG
jgi:hypothetical protein